MLSWRERKPPGGAKSKARREAQSHSGEITAMDFNTDQTLMVSAGTDQIVSPAHGCLPHTDLLSRVKLTRDGPCPTPYLLQLAIWHVETAELLTTIMRHNNAVTGVKFVPHADWVYTGSTDYCTKVTADVSCDDASSLRFAVLFSFNACTPTHCTHTLHTLHTAL